MSDPKEFLSRTGYRRVTASSIAPDMNLPGSPTTTTQPPEDNSNKIATTAYVDYVARDFTHSFLLMGA